MRALVVAAPLLLLTAALAGCFHGGPAPDPGPATAGCPTVGGRETQAPLWTIETSLGSITIELCQELAPVTVKHFQDMVRSNRYNGATFYRVVGPRQGAESGFVIQAGIQQGAQSAPKVPQDEFHPLLRHDRAGVLSVAHAGPGTGSTEFFVTLTATPHLDDRHAVFGYVVRGLRTVRDIGDVKVDTGDKPVTPVTISKMTLSDDPDPPAAHGAVAAYSVATAKAAAPDDGVAWSVVGRNLGNAVDNLSLSISGPAGWNTSVVGAAKAAVAAGKGHVFLVSALAPVGTEPGVYPLTATVKSGRNASAIATVALVAEVATLGEAVQDGWRVEGNYIGMLEDGRIFDSSLESVAKDGALLKMNTSFSYRGDGNYRPFTFTVGGQVIGGFTKLAKTALVGEQVVGRLAVADAYARGDVYENPLVGKPLVFELQILKRCATTAASDPC